MIVFDDDRIGAAVTVDGWGAVPAEVERPQELAGWTELHQVPLRVVVARIGAEQDGAIRCDGGRGRCIVEHATRTRLVRPWIDAGMRTDAAAARLSVERQNASADCTVIAPIVQMSAERGGPASGEIWIHCDQVIVAADEVGAADRIDGPVRRHGR